MANERDEVSLGEPYVGVSTKFPRENLTRGPGWFHRLTRPWPTRHDLKVLRLVFSRVIVMYTQLRLPLMGIINEPPTPLTRLRDCERS